MLLVGGVGMLSTGYLIAVVAGGISTGVASGQTGTYGASCLSGAGLNFIPLFGPWLFSAQYPRHQVVGYGSAAPELLDCNGSRSLVTTTVVADEILQLGGAALLAGALAYRHLGPERASARRVEILPGTVATPLGLTLLASDL